jgi:hypothetical protein
LVLFYEVDFGLDQAMPALGPVDVFLEICGLDEGWGRGQLIRGFGRARVVDWVSWEFWTMEVTDLWYSRDWSRVGGLRLRSVSTK